MAQIGYGYGSEFQLLRFMGRHRKMLDNEICTSLHESGHINWLDFSLGTRFCSITGDEELKGLSFLNDESITKIYTEDVIKRTIKDYKKYNINNIDKWQNWDAVFTLNNIIYLVEAKAYVHEFKDGNNIHGEKSQKEIERFFSEQMNMTGLKANINEEWFKSYYQFANRLAMAAFLNNHNIKTKVLYIFFLNGFSKRTVEEGKIIEVINKDKDSTKKKFEAVLSDAKIRLGLEHCNLNGILCDPIYINSYTE